jgi:hypothetical protein
VAKVKLTEILEKFNNRKSYQELDAKALDISRKAAAGDWGESEYADWALISNDPLVMVNIVRTFITVLVSKLSTSPFRPEDDQLNELGMSLKLNSLFTKIYQDVLIDGYAYVSIGYEAGKPVVVPVDARFVIFIADEQTLEDADDVLVFEVVGLPIDHKDRPWSHSAPNLETYVKFNKQHEKVIVKHYSRRDGVVYLDIYDESDELENKNHYELTGLTRIPIIRFVGEEVELNDQRVHYRGLYHLTSSVLKAMVLAATKVNIQTAAADDDNYLAPIDSIKNHLKLWTHSGIKTYDSKDANGQAISAPAPIPHDLQGLTAVFETWKNVISSMLGPVVQSSSEAITREEVLARNEVRDAITNAYLSKIADSIAQVYMVMQQFMTMQPVPEPKIIGGFMDTVKRNVQKQELMQIYNLAKESGLNTQGFVNEFVRLGDLGQDIKARLTQTFQQDPFKSPLTEQLQNTINQLQQTIVANQQQIAVLRTQASQRLERQDSYVSMVERTKRMDIEFKQWQQETRDTQAARMELMKDLLAKGNLPGALEALKTIEERDRHVLTDPNVQQSIAAGDLVFDNPAYRTTPDEIITPAEPAVQPEITTQWG